MEKNLDVYFKSVEQIITSKNRSTTRTRTFGFFWNQPTKIVQNHARIKLIVFKWFDSKIQGFRDITLRIKTSSHHIHLFSLWSFSWKKDSFSTKFILKILQNSKCVLTWTQNKIRKINTTLTRIKAHAFKNGPKICHDQCRCNKVCNFGRQLL